MEVTIMPRVVSVSAAMWFLRLLHDFGLAYLSRPVRSLLIRDILPKQGQYRTEAACLPGTYARSIASVI
jgi:hypothetical protein